MIFLFIFLSFLTFLRSSPTTTTSSFVHDFDFTNAAVAEAEAENFCIDNLVLRLTKKLSIAREPSPTSIAEGEIFELHEIGDESQQKEQLEDVEEEFCGICYSVSISDTTNSPMNKYPHLTNCCRQRMHQECLSNWNSSCPFCRFDQPILETLSFYVSRCTWPPSPPSQPLQNHFLMNEIDSIDDNGNSLAHTAITHDFIDFLILITEKHQYLLQVINDDGVLPFQLAMGLGRIAAVKLLLPFIDLSCYNPVFDAIACCDNYPIKIGILMLTTLIEYNGFWISERDSRGKLPIEYTCFKTKFEAFKLLLESHPESLKFLSLKARKRMLRFAIIRNSFPLFKLLQQSLPSIDCRIGKGLMTPLHIAAFYGRKRMVLFLLRFGANRDIRNLYGQSTYFIAYSMVPSNRSLFLEICRIIRVFR